MPINAHKLGPGTLELGAVPLEVAIQLTACKVTPSETVTSTDKIPVVSGDELPAEESADYSFVLEGSFLQDLSAVASVVDWSWANMGTEQPFTFTPNTAAGKTVDGILTPVPLTIGGDEADGAHMQSSFTWRIKGTPDLS